MAMISVGIEFLIRMNELLCIYKSDNYDLFS
jgi:hypothetical protein